MMMILGSQSGVFELRLTGERSLQIITQDDVERLMSIHNGRLYFNLNTKISSQNWLRSSSDHLEKKFFKLFGYLF